MGAIAGQPIITRKLKEIQYSIREQSWLAKAAAWKLGTRHMAIVLGSCIHLFNCTKEEFLQNEHWLKHELCHVRQFKQHGFFTFILKYLWESIQKGYYNNKYEVEARAAEEAA